MSKPSANVHQHEQTFSFLVVRFIAQFVRRMFMRLFVLPFYVIVFLPWIILFLDDPRGKENTILFKTVALLSGSPGATQLDEGNLILATVVVFALFDFSVEAYSWLKGKPSSFISRDKQDFKRRLYIQCALSLTGWTSVGVIKFRNDLEGLFVFIGFGLVSCAFFWGEYNFRLILHSINWKKLFLSMKSSSKDNRAR